VNPTIRQAIARIDVVQGDKSGSRGTGVLVTADLVLTAMHVVADRSSPTLALYPGTISLAFPGHVTVAHVVDRGWSPNADWILLRCITPPPCEPMPIADSAADSDTWETYGFPDANPRDGMVQIGTIENAAGVFENVPAYQLYSKQAAAGSGAPVKGLSGGPVIVDGALVAVLRSSLMRDGQNVAGTLYGCPIDLILQASGDLLPIPDPCRGLPGLPRQPLPAAPFRFLERFTAADAEIFFGRNREIRQLRDTTMAEGGPPVILMYGQSGAGKSSFLDAGLLPRLLSTHVVLYLRREREKGLLATLLDGLRSQLTARGTAPTAEGAEALRLAWLEVEAAAGKPAIVVVDQVEEVFTLPGHDATELTAFVDAIAAVFHAGTSPRGRIVLGFRKEWFAEIQKQLEVKNVDFAKVFLETLDAPAVVEIITGLQRTRRLRDRYGLDVEAGLADAIARDLAADRDSPVAPTLQVLLSKMWREASAANAHAPGFSAALYERLNKDGVLLTDFFDQQLAALQQSASSAGGSRADVVESGLAVDLLTYHTTPFGSAEQRNADEVAAEYSHRPDDAAWLVQELKRLYLLADAAGDAEQTRSSARLSHDTLARVVRARFEVSGRPGQRSRRILENRAGEWSQDRTGVPLDGRDLALVEQGLPGMRRLRPDEERLLHASREQASLVRRSNTRRRTAAIGAVAVIAIIAAIAAWLLLLRLRQQEWTKLFEIEALVPVLLEVEPVNGLVGAIEAIDRNLLLNGLLLPGTRGNLVRALGEARERGGWRLDDGANALAVSSDNRIAVGTNDGMVKVFGFDGSEDIPAIRAAGAGTQVKSVAFSDDGELVAAASGRQGLGIWTRSGKPVTSEQTPDMPLGMATAVQFAPGGHVLVAAFSSGEVRTLYVCDVDRGAATATAIRTLDDIESIATTQTSTGLLLIATVAGDVTIWNASGQVAWKPDHFGVGAITTADLIAVRDPQARILLAAGTTDGTVMVWDTSRESDKKKPSQMFPQVGSAITAVAFGYQGRLLHAGTRASAVRTYDLVRNTEAMEPLTTSDVPQALAVSADGERVVTLAMRTVAASVQLFDLVGPQFLFPLAPPKPAAEDARTRWNDIAFAGNDVVVLGGLGQSIPRWRVKVEPYEAWAERELTLVDSGQDETVGVASDASGQVVALAGAHSVQFLIADQRIPGEKALPAEANAVAVSPNGAIAVVGSSNGAITLWEPRSGQLLRTAQAHTGDVWAVAFNAAGTLFATGGADGVIRTWGADGGDRPAIKRASAADTSALSYHADGTLFVGDSAGRIERINQSGKVLLSTQVFRNESVKDLVISRDGETIFIAGSAGVRALDVASGAVLSLRFPRVPESITDLAISSDGTLLAGVTAKADVLLWRADWNTWLSEACDRLKRHPVFVLLNSAKPDAGDTGARGVNVQSAFDACSSHVWKGATP
jgi:WD40 repeat protein